MKKNLIVLATMLLLVCTLVLVACGKSPVNMTITFVADGVVYQTITTADVNTVVMPADPTKEGETFLGWYRDYGVWNEPFTLQSLLDVPIKEQVTVNVYARFSSSPTISTEATKLAVPTDVRVEGGYLRWTDVDNAVSYTVVYNGASTTVIETQYRIADENKSYTIRVCANGDGTQYASSDYSATISFTASEGYYSQFDELTKKEAFLGYGFDVINSSVFSDRHVKTSMPILNTNELLNMRLLKVDSKYSYINEIQSESMDDFMAQWNAQANVDVSYGKKKVGGSVNVEVAYSGGVSNAKSKYFHCISINNQKFYIVLQGDLDTYKSILNDGFKKDLYSDLSPAELFNRYGTHFITSAVMGGKIYAYYLYSSEEETSFHDISAEVSAEIRKMTTKVNVDVAGGYRQSASSKNIYIKNTLEVLGGEDYGMLTDDSIPQYYADWEKSLNEHAALIGIKDTGSLWPLWDLIDPSLDTNTYYFEDMNGEVVSGTRAQQLQTYFYKYGLDKYNDLMQAAGLPSIVVPEAITNIAVNGVAANEKDEYFAYAGVNNDIWFGVSPETATGYTKSIAVVGDNPYAEVNDKNQLYIKPTAPSDLRVEVALGAGGLKKIINVLVRRTYTVEFIANHGEDPAPIYNVRYGTHIAEPIWPKWDGYEFKGWYTHYSCNEESRFDFLNDAITQDLILYGKWAVKKNTITVTLDGAGATLDTTKILVEPDGTYEGLPKSVLYTGHNFLGWYYGDTKVDATSAVASNASHTLVAKWELRSYTVYVDTNWGNADWTNKTVSYGDSVPTPGVWRSEHEFMGWSNKPDKMPDYDITIKANWLRVQQTSADSTEYYYNKSGGNQYHLYFDFNLQALKDNGYNKIKIQISFDLKEEYDCYEHFTVYMGNDNWSNRYEYNNDKGKHARMTTYKRFYFDYEKDINLLCYNDIRLNSWAESGDSGSFWIRNVSITVTAVK